MLALIASCELLGMTLWFSASSVTPALGREFHLDGVQLAWVTMAVQGGFVVGTLISALLNLPDLFSTRRLFAAGCLLGAAATLAATRAGSPAGLIAWRVATGAALAWVYPTGMKLAASWFGRRRGTALAIIVASLTMGQAFPHLLAALVGQESWRTVLSLTAALAMIGGLAALTWVREGPLTTPAERFDPHAVTRLFTNRHTRLAALGYFGHMWELYAMWTWAGAFVAASLEEAGTTLSLGAASVASFIAVATGSVGCLVAGLAADRVGRANVAGWALRASGLCAIAACLVFGAPPALLFTVVAIWGLTVVADSAQFSAMVADYSGSNVGTALTIQTSIGYLLTMVSIRLVPASAVPLGWRWAFLVLVPGPLVGAMAMARLSRLQRRDGPPSAGADLVSGLGDG